MRGSDGRAGELFAYVDLERRVPADHPLRIIRAVVNAALSELSGAFGPLYARLGRPSIAPREAVAGLAAAGILLDPLGAPAHGTARVRPPVPLVRGSWDR